MIYKSCARFDVETRTEQLDIIFWEFDRPTTWLSSSLLFFVFFLVFIDAHGFLSFLYLIGGASHRAMIDGRRRRRRPVPFTWAHLRTR